MIEKLREEIIESQKVRTDLLKWKLILVAAIGGTALGIGSGPGASMTNSAILFALIPFVCLYVDAICFHNEIRIMAIARFLRTHRPLNSLEKQYEDFCKENRSQFQLEGFALLITTLLLSTLVLALGWRDNLNSLMNLTSNPPALVKSALTCSGIAGLALGLMFYVYYRKRIAFLDSPFFDQRRVEASEGANTLPDNCD